MLTFAVTFAFNDPDRGYIGDPYHAEMYRVIQITKESGMNRARSQANRRKALEEYLRQVDMTLAEFEALKARAEQPFIKNEQGWIVLPLHTVEAFLVATADEIRSAGRFCPPEQVRSRVRCTTFTTDRREPDGVWERFATVTAGTGAKLSNQRALRINPYIRGFTARGTITIDEQSVDPATLEQAIRWGGQFVGIGASRKMGWGRFELQRFEALAAAA